MRTTLFEHGQIIIVRFFITIVISFFVFDPAVFADESDTVTEPPPGSYKILSGDGTIRIPFELYRGDIRYKCKVNGHPVHMLLDDGFLWDQLLFWGGPVVDSLGFTYDGEVGVGGGNDGYDVGITSKTASGITVSFSDVEFYDQTAVVTPSGSGVYKMWSGSAGQISAMFFKHFVVDINFDNMLITLTPGDEFEYHGRGAEVAWRPMGFGPRGIPATLNLADGRQISMTLLMDLGYNDQLQLQTGEEHDITVPDKKVPSVLGRNIQGEETQGYIGRLPSVTIGGHELENPLVAYIAKENNEHTISEAMIGLGLLSRFNLTFDFYGQRIFFEPARNFAEPYEYNMAGFSSRRAPEGYLEIEQVIPGSPAEEIGLEVGDRVYEINGRAAADYDVFELKPLLRQEGATVELLVGHDGEKKTVPLTLRRLL
ncbi:MAG: PDZ domain-containing protein [Candidatus Zixiibacteriota bacterium]